ncbi:sulfotransferase [Lysobacter sp. Root494]|uniref:sulfotransferase n=1 Tax=Lysobacter sp. Root494 TaxID=1736549 RepID=UPI0006FC1B3D|nr:sulfotransferase [Lysobacter sp. Root494]KQY49303.1 hypothetical protein ASD14_14635 [Lysobacter sp. Root494]
MTPLDDPAYLPFKLDLVGRRALLVRFDAAQRREAAFLDDRALSPQADGGWIPLDQLLSFSIEAAHADAIFHIGHCGSTLLSRLLESWPRVQALREPLPLRTLAEAWPQRTQPESRLSARDTEHCLDALWSALSRPVADGGRVVIKATSSCNVLAEPLLRGHPETRAILLDMPLRSYLATLLKSPDSSRDATAGAIDRLRDLRARCGDEDLFLHALSVPQQCAMGWVAERLRFAALARAYGERVLRIDFEQLLAEPESTLERIAAHYGLAPGGIVDAMRSPAWDRYSKAQSHGYGREDRAHDLMLAMQRHGADIAHAEQWHEAFLQRHPQLAADLG